MSDRLIEPFPQVAAIRLEYAHQFVRIWNGIPQYQMNYNSVSNFTKSITIHFLINEHEVNA